MKNDANSMVNTYDGNMKLQKLLVFANLANIAENGELLYQEEILAFQNGCVVEKVRLRYRNDYASLKRDSEKFEPDFTEREYKILNIVLNVFGNCSARELSEINHAFDFWKIAFDNGTNCNGYHNKERSIVNIMSCESDINRMKEIIAAYNDISSDVTASEIINGITFYYDNITLTDEIIEQLEIFSLSAEDDSYSVYEDCGRLVIY